MSSLPMKAVDSHTHEHEWLYDQDGESGWLCRCGDLVTQYEDCPSGR